jgi:hypothetical protein
LNSSCHFSELELDLDAIFKFMVLLYKSKFLENGSGVMSLCACLMNLTIYMYSSSSLIMPLPPKTTPLIMPLPPNTTPLIGVVFGGRGIIRGVVFGGRVIRDKRRSTKHYTEN